MTIQFRQGDVFLKKIEESFDFNDGSFIPVEKEGTRTVLAHGEATGHAHAFYTNDVNLFKHTESNKIYLAVDNTAILKHEEHAEIKIPSGLYQVIRQREYTPQEIRQIAD